MLKGKNKAVGWRGSGTNFLGKKNIAHFSILCRVLKGAVNRLVERLDDDQL